MGFLDNAKDKLGRRRSTTHGDKIADGIDKAADVADEKTGGKHADKIDAGAEKAKDAPRLARRQGRRHPADADPPTRPSDA